MFRLNRARTRYTALILVFSILLSTTTPASADPGRMVRGAVAACVLAFASLNPGAIRAQDPAPARVEQRAEEPRPRPLNELREEMKRPVTQKELAELTKAIEGEVQKGKQERAAVPATGSYARDFVQRVFENPKYRWIGVSIVLFEAAFVGILWRRLSLNAAQWKRRMAAGSQTELNLRPHVNALHHAEVKLVKALRQLAEADRQALIKIVEGMTNLPERNKNILLAVLRRGVVEPEGAPRIDIDEAFSEYAKAYSALQAATVAEARVLSAAGPREVQPMETFDKAASAEEPNVRAIHGLDFGWRQLEDVKTQLKHLDQEGRRETGQDLSLRRRVWRYSRNTLLLMLLPIIALGVNQSYDSAEEAERRQQDLNTAALQDREKALRAFLPNLHRPLLWAVVRVWNEEPRLRAFNCPVRLRALEEDNPDLQIMQALVFRTIMEMEMADPVRNGGLEFRFDEKFFEKLLPKVMALNPALERLDERTKNEIVADLSFRAARAFDEISARPVPDPVVPPAGGGAEEPPLGFGRP